MKIIIVSNTTFSIYNYRLSLIKTLKEKGFQVTVVAPCDKYVKKIKKEGIAFLPLSNLNRKGVSPLRDFILFLEFVKIYSKEKPDMILHFTIKPNIWGSLACGILNIPSISVVTGLGYVFVFPSYYREGIPRAVLEASFKFSSKVIFQNPDDMKLFIQKGIVKLNKAKIIYGSGIDPEKFKPKEVAKNENFTFIFIGRLLWDKGLKEIIEACKILKKKGYSFDFFIVGKIDEGNPNSISILDIEKWQEEKIIKYLGFQEDVKKYLIKADVFVFPSYYREGIPRAVLEAMSMEKPIITTDSPGCRETVRDGINGLLIKPKDYIDLADAMEKIMKMPKEKLEKMGKESRRIVLEKFNEEKVIKQYIDTIIEVLKTKSKI